MVGAHKALHALHAVSIALQQTEENTLGHFELRVIDDALSYVQLSDSAAEAAERARNACRYFLRSFERSSSRVVRQKSVVQRSRVTAISAIQKLQQEIDGSPDSWVVSLLNNLTDFSPGS